MINKFSQAGSYHANDDFKNQDVLCYGETEEYSVITLADGVSSCQKARKGAEIASQALTDLLLRKADYFFDYTREKAAKFVLEHILYELQKEAEKEAENIAEYSSTIASVVIDKKSNKLLYMSLGDSMILYTKNGRCRVLERPADSRNGCPVTTTKNGFKLFSSEVIDATSLDSVMICSDGAWKNMFENDRLKQNMETLILRKDYGGLQKVFQHLNCHDDYSMISVDIGE